jgi:hypothetical protein
MRKALLAGNAIAMTLLVSCSGAVDCKMPTCLSGIVVENAPPDSIACVDGKCALAGVAMAVDRRQKSYVVEVGTRRYEGPLVFSKFQLGGPGCGPTCYVARLVVEGDSITPAPPTTVAG